MQLASASLPGFLCLLGLIRLPVAGPWPYSVRADPPERLASRRSCSCPTETDQWVIKIGFLSSYITNKVILGAIPLAVNQVNSDPALLPGRTLAFQPADTGDANKGRLQSLAIRRMTEMRDGGVMAFIGPGASCVNEALVAAAWNLPLITFHPLCRTTA